VFILHEYDFNIVHKSGKVNWDVNGLSWNPSSNEKDTIGARWHGEVDLEVVLGWHVFTYMCTLLGCSKDVPQGNMGGGNSHNDDDEPKCINVMDIHLNLLVMAYLHASEVLVGLTPKEQDRIIHRVKQF